MPRFSSYSFPSIIAGIALLASAAAAQAPMPVAPAAVPAPVVPTPAVPAPAAPPALTAPPAPVAAAIDPKVTALFNQSIAAHQAINALSATITASTTGLTTPANETFTLAFQKPNEARIAISSSSGPVVQFVSDGKTLTVYAIHDKKYRADTVPPGASVIPAVLSQAHALLPRLIGQPEALGDLLVQPGVTASFGTPLTIAGVVTDTVNATLPAPDGSSSKLTFSFGAADHLLRQVIQIAAVPRNGVPQTITHTETVTSINPTPTLTDAEFVFIPPPGVTKIIAGATPSVTPPSAPAGPLTKEVPMHDPRLVPDSKPLTFAAKDLSGKPLSLTQYHGKIVLMDFWATWCGPCVAEMPNVIAAYKKYHAQGFEIVGVSLDESRPALTAFVKKNQMPWRQVFDGKGWNSAVPRRYGVTAIPFGLLIGRDGRIAAVDVRGPALTAAIKKALSKKVALAK